MTTKIVGIALIVFGVLMLAFTGFQMYTTQKIVDIGPIEINRQVKHSFDWPPVAGIVLIVAGAIIVVRDLKPAT